MSFGRLMLDPSFHNDNFRDNGPHMPHPIEILLFPYEERHRIESYDEEHMGRYMMDYHWWLTDEDGRLFLQVGRMKSSCIVS